MRQITVLAIGRMKDRALESLQQEYTKRLAAFCRTEIIEVRDEPNEHTERPGEVEQTKDREAARALEKIRPGDFVVLLDLHGTDPWVRGRHCLPAPTCAGSSRISPSPI